MTLFNSKPQSVSAWASVVHASGLAAVASPASNLAAVLHQDTANSPIPGHSGWFDVEFVNFSWDDWKFISITEGDLRTGLRHQTRAVGKLVTSLTGATMEEFTFADPINDPRLVRQGLVKYLHPVSEQEIVRLLSAAGVFDVERKSHYNKNRYKYIWEEGQGGGALDFAMKQLPKVFKVNLDVESEDKLVNYLFYIDNVAHNYFNFGNFLYGAAGAALGLKETELTMGAHANSLLNSEKNSYPAQFDSADDQLSILAGYKHAVRKHYAQRHTKWVQLQRGLPRKD